MSRALFVAVAFAAVAGCRGGVSEDPPYQLATDMDWQPHRRAQSKSDTFADHRAMRPREKNTIARGFLKEDDAFFLGNDASGKPIARIPFAVTPQIIARGEDRFGVFCTPCHDETGAGNGLVAQRSGGAFSAIPQLYMDRLKEAPDGEIFQTISHGKGRMPSYASQIPESDRWAIVTWVRVLQQSQAASLSDVPAADRSKIKAADAEGPAAAPPAAASGSAAAPPKEAK